MKKQNSMIFRYFWATFTLHILVYALLSHVIIRYWSDTNLLLLSLVGILITLPFTVVMLKRYKQMAVAKVNQESIASIHTYISRQHDILSSFFTFKKRYEMILIPVISAVGVIITFNLFFPGGVLAFPVGALVTYLLTLLSCRLAIRSENRKSFAQPLQELQAILDECRS